MKLYQYIGVAALALPCAAPAQTVTFEPDSADYSAIGVYDTWEASPFRTGELEGHVAIVANPYDRTDGENVNATPYCLAVQRSRYGSNTFGARIDLKEPFELTPETQYVHVMIHKPVDGRVMLVGLGKRRDWEGQSADTEQFWAYSSSSTKTNEWFDAVFAVAGAGGIDIYSLVVIPHCESPHTLSADFAAYIDEIERTTSAASRGATTDYPINCDEETEITRTDRLLNSVSVSENEHGEQTVTVGSADPNLLYRKMLTETLYARAGEEITTTFNYTGIWMSGYVYLDRGSDGVFSCELNDDYTCADTADIMAYSFYNYYNSNGESVDNGNVLNPPTFTMPNLDNGIYRMRFKVDWDCIDPGGNASSDNLIASNGGFIVDVRMNIHGDYAYATAYNRNGEVTCADGNTLNNLAVPFLQDFTIRMAPENGFTYEGIRVRHGYNLSGDSLVHSTPQYFDEYYTADEFGDDNTFTIPGEVMDGDVLIEGLFVEATAESIETAPVEEAAPAALTVKTAPGKLIISAPIATEVIVADAAGRKIYHDTLVGAKTLAEPKGVYVVNNQTVLVP